MLNDSTVKMLQELLSDVAEKSAKIHRLKQALEDSQKEFSEVLGERNEAQQELLELRKWAHTGKEAAGHYATVTAPKIQQMKEALETAYGLIVRHHESSFGIARPGGFCPVCHHEDHTEPEMDKIAKALALP